MISLTTDFGTRDWFVGTMKGVIAEIAPDARVIDITHEVRPGDIRGGAFALAAAARFFPRGTIHVAVVDPGVGSARRAIAVRTRDAVFVGPDNGVLSWAVREQKVDEVRKLTNNEWFLTPISRTFHGRDIFAPVAAHLSAGAAFAEAGEIVPDFERLPWPEPKRTDGRLLGEVVHVDRFGNAITNIPAADLPEDIDASGSVRVRCGNAVVAIRGCYSAAMEGAPLAVAGSSGFVELAINGGDFAAVEGVKPGDSAEVLL